MKQKLGFLASIGIVILLGWYYGGDRLSTGRVTAPPNISAVLPSAKGAKAILNSTYRHRQWVNIPAGFADIRAFIVYPQRSNKAPVVVVSASRQGASDWIRAVADSIAANGFIAIVPDVLSGLGPHGGDANAFPSASAVAVALDRLGPAEIARRTNAVREYAVALPSANGQGANVDFEVPSEAGPDAGFNGRIEITVDAPVAGRPAASFSGGQAYLQAVSFLIRQTGDRPEGGVNPDVPEDHSAHIGMMMAQTPTGKGEGRGFPKVPNIPADIHNARGTLNRTKLRHEFVDIPMGTANLHKWVEYPEGDGKAPIVVVMEHAPGLDEWQRAVVDQLAQDGFIAIAPDLATGMGPNGGNWDSFEDSDAVSRAVSRLTDKDKLDRFKLARDWGMKLPRANGKSASIGFCVGGGDSFRFAAEVPDLNAAVSYYGNPSRTFDYSKIKAPILAFYGEEDARVTATLAGTKAAMKQNDKSFESYVYPHATHGFVQFQLLVENQAALKDAWPKTLAFLRKHTM